MKKEKRGGPRKGAGLKPGTPHKNAQKPPQSENCLSYVAMLPNNSTRRMNSMTFRTNEFSDKVADILASPPQGRNIMLSQINTLLQGRITKKSARQKGFLIEEYRLPHRRTATQVTLPNGRTIRFMEKMGVKMAMENIKFQMERNPEDWN